MVSVSPVTILEGARQAVAAGDVEGAVASLVSVWAKIPSPRIGELAIRLSAGLPHETLPAKVGERERRWLELASSKDAAVVPALLSVEWPAHPRAVKARLDRLAEFPPDPRIAAAFRDLWHARAYRSRAGGVFWRRAFRLLLNWNDPGTAAILTLAKRDDGYEILESVVERRTKTPLPTEPEVSTEVAQVVTEIEALVGTPAAKMTKSQLLEDIYANPRDEGPRLVLADLLVAENDPRGELIQLQSAIAGGRGPRGKLQARVNTLLHAFGRKWLDGLDAMVNWASLFHLGFASDVTLEKTLDPTVRAWRTVETLRCARFDQLTTAEPLLHENLANIRHVHGISVRTLALWLSRCGKRKLDVVEAFGPLDQVPSCEAQIGHLSVRGGVVQRGSLRVRYGYAETFEWFERSSLANHVALLEVDPIDRNATDLEMLAHVLPLAVADLDRGAVGALWLRPVSHHDVTRPMDATPIFWDVRVSRDAPGAPTVFHAHWNGVAYGVVRRESVMTLVRALEALDTPVSALDVRASQPLGASLQGELARALDDTLRKHPSVVVTMPVKP